MRGRWIAAVALSSSVLHAQAPSFEVASIKRNTTGGTASIRAQPGGRMTITNNPLRGLILNSYGLEDYQVAGGPDWITAERWDIVAKAASDAPRPQLDLMLRVLLADRFKLATHNEVRSVPLYALVRARPDGRLGPDIRTSSVDCEDRNARCGWSGVMGNMTGTGRTISQLARTLAPLVGRGVADKTGLSGTFDLTLKWAPEGQAASDGAALVTALQEQLGLKLEPQRLPVEVLVIDAAERPAGD